MRRDARRSLSAAGAGRRPSSVAQQAQQKPFEPTVGQAGKDVVWVPTPPELVEKMLDMAQVTPQDVVMDLGSGDGRNIIAAAKRGATRDRRRIQPRHGGAVATPGQGSRRRRQGDVHRGRHVRGRHLQGHGAWRCSCCPTTSTSCRDKFFALKPGIAHRDEHLRYPRLGSRCHRDRSTATARAGARRCSTSSRRRSPAPGNRRRAS